MNVEDGTNGRAEGVRRFSVVHFLIALVALLVMTPFVEEMENGDLIEAALLTIVLLTAVLAVGGQRRTLAAATVLVVPALVGTWLDHLEPGLVPRDFTLVATLGFVVFVVGHLLAFILRAAIVNAEVLAAGIAVYLMLGLTWALVFTLAARLEPDAFAFTLSKDPTRKMEKFEALYFSFGTMTTIGYGDIIPVTNGVRMLAMTEAVTGVFYMAVLIARLVSLYAGRQTPPPPDATEPETRNTA